IISRCWWNLRSPRLERKPFLTRFDLNQIAVSELALQDALSQRILNVSLDQPLERSGAVHRIISLPRQPVASIRTGLQMDLAIFQPLVELSYLNIDNLLQLIGCQSVEDDSFIDTVEELRTEVLPQRLEHFLLHLRISRVAGDSGLQLVVENVLAADVGGHDD